MICEKCGRVMLRCEEQIMDWVNICYTSPGVLGHALEDSHREHVCRNKK